MSIPSKAQITHEILAYLAENQNAQDTLEGIAEWWLLEQKIKHRTTEIKEVLDDLVAQNLILERKGRDARRRYQINRRKLAEISSLLKQQPD
jgi:hypothetical protein